MIPKDDIAHLVPPRYKLEDYVGRGASSEVWKVADLVDGQCKAAKIIALGDGDTDIAAERERVASEFLLGTRFVHPHLARYNDLYLPQNSSHAVVVMEYVPGASLSKPPANVDACAALILQVLSALELLHNAGYVHGDVKPGNVLWRNEAGGPVAKLLDYHLTYRPRDVDFHTTRGTLRYLAPEAISGYAVDLRSDLYATGAMFYEMLAGHPLFTGTPREVASQHVTSPVPPLALQHPRAGGLQKFLDRLLAKNPAGRYADAAEAAAELSRLFEIENHCVSVDSLLAHVRSVPLIGRKEAVECIHGFLDQSGAQPDFLQICGATGCGKSRLLTEAIRMAQTRGYITLSLSDLPDSAAFISSVERALGVTSPPGAEEPRRLGDIASALANVSRRQPVLIAIDDADKAPQSCQAALQFVMQATRSNRVSFCLAAASEAPVWLAETTSARSSGRAYLKLADLSPEDARAFISSALPKSVGEAVVKEIAARCGGSPAALAATLTHLIANGSLGQNGWQKSPDKEAFDSLPRSLFGENILSGIPDLARQAVSVMAISSVDLDMMTLSAIVSAPSERVIDALAQCPKVVSLQRSSEGTLCRFQHISLRDVLLRQMGQARVAEINDHTAQALALLPHTSRWQVARHLLLGANPARGVNLLTDCLHAAEACPSADAVEILTLALPYAQNADRLVIMEARADRLVAAGQIARAREQYAELAAAADPGTELSVRALRKMASMDSRLQKRQEAKTVLNELLANQSAAAAFPNEHAKCLLALAAAHSKAGEHEDALRHARQALAEGVALRDEGIQAQAIMQTANVLVSQGKQADARAPGFKALWHARRSKDKTLVADAIAMLAWTGTLQGRTARAAALVSRAVSMMKQEGRMQDLAMFLHRLGANHQMLSEWDQAIQCYEEARENYEKVNDFSGALTMTLNLSYINLTIGNLEASIHAAQKALPMAVKAGPLLYCVTLARVTQGEYMLGNLDGATVHANELLESATAAGLDYQAEVARRILGESAMLRGEWADSVRHMRAAVELTQKASALRKSMCLIRLAEALLEAGEFAEALANVEKAMTHAQESGMRDLIAHADAMRGRIALATGDLDTAMDRLQLALPAFRKRQSWDELMGIHLRLAKIHDARDNMRLAAYQLRCAVDQMDHVVRRLRNPANVRIFMNDPRRRRLCEYVRDFRQRVEQAAG